METKIERRFLNAKLECREAKDGKPAQLAGLAVPFESPSLLLDEDGAQFVELIAADAFDGTLDSGAEVMMLFSHEWDKPLARRSSGRLELTREADGIHFAATPPETTLAQDLIKDIAAGNIQGMSFGFSAAEDEWFERDGKLTRRVLKGILYEISPVVNPAYPDTAIASRSLKDFRNRERAETDRENFMRLARLRLLKRKYTTSTKDKK